MPVAKNCASCGSHFRVQPARKATARFCSKACHDAAQRTAPRRNIKCKECGTKFHAPKDHGVWPKYCSRECFGAGAVKPKQKKCPGCDSFFIATRSSHPTADGLRTYCSYKCRHAGLRNGELRACLNCGQDFYVNLSKQKQRNDEGCCSTACQRHYYVGVRSKHWKGGRYLDNHAGDVRINLPRPGYVSPYVGEHRIIASKAIGRLLQRYEPILHLNQHRDDNRPANLFICGSIGEATNRIHGRLPWPKESNLGTFK